MAQDENAKHRKLLAEAILDNAVLKEVTSKRERPVVAREAVERIRPLRPDELIAYVQDQSII